LGDQAEVHGFLGFEQLARQQQFAGTQLAHLNEAAMAGTKPTFTSV
jgi:hypothetical protein